MIKKAVIEKITNDSIVLLLGEKEKEIVIQKVQIPHFQKYKVGDWLDVEVIGEHIETIHKNQEETKKVKKRIEAKMERLRKRMDSK